MAMKTGVSVALALLVASASLGAFDEDSGPDGTGAPPARSAKSKVANGGVRGDTASTSSTTAVARAAMARRSRVNDTNIFIFGCAVRYSRSTPEPKCRREHPIHSAFAVDLPPRRCSGGDSPQWFHYNNVVESLRVYISVVRRRWRRVPPAAHRCPA